jgi:hypothetical protein
VEDGLAKANFVLQATGVESEEDMDGEIDECCMEEIGTDFKGLLDGKNECEVASGGADDGDRRKDGDGILKSPSGNVSAC